MHKLTCWGALNQSESEQLRKTLNLSGRSVILINLPDFAKLAELACMAMEAKTRFGVPGLVCCEHFLARNIAKVFDIDDVPPFIFDSHEWERPEKTPEALSLTMQKTGIQSARRVADTTHPFPKGEQLNNLISGALSAPKSLNCDWMWLDWGSCPQYAENATARGEILLAIHEICAKATGYACEYRTSQLEGPEFQGLRFDEVYMDLLDLVKKSANRLTALRNDLPQDVLPSLEELNKCMTSGSCDAVSRLKGIGPYDLDYLTRGWCALERCCLSHCKWGYCSGQDVIKDEKVFDAIRELHKMTGIVVEISGRLTTKTKDDEKLFTAVTTCNNYWVVPMGYNLNRFIPNTSELESMVGLDGIVYLDQAYAVSVDSDKEIIYRNANLAAMRVLEQTPEQVFTPIGAGSVDSAPAFSPVDYAACNVYEGNESLWWGGYSTIKGCEHVASKAVEEYAALAKVDKNGPQVIKFFQKFVPLVKSITSYLTIFNNFGICIVEKVAQLADNRYIVGVRGNCWNVVLVAPMRKDKGVDDMDYSFKKTLYFSIDEAAQTVRMHTVADSAVNQGTEITWEVLRERLGGIGSYRVSLGSNPINPI